jgi:hypothetical protein
VSGGSFERVKKTQVIADLLSTMSRYKLYPSYECTTRSDCRFGRVKFVLEACMKPKSI